MKIFDKEVQESEKWFIINNLIKEIILNALKTETDIASNHILSELKLRDYKFYRSFINLNREEFENLQRIYNSLGQFDYWDQRD